MGFEGKVTNSATFSAPGQYVLTVQAFDSTGVGGDGFQCCWSTAKVNVTVAPSHGRGGITNGREPRPLSLGTWAPAPSSCSGGNLGWCRLR